MNSRLYYQSYARGFNTLLPYSRYFIYNNLRISRNSGDDRKFISVAQGSNELIFTKSKQSDCWARRNMATSSTNSRAGQQSPTSDNAESKESRNRKTFKVNKEELKARLSPIQYQVTQLKSTERPGSGEYNKFNKPGRYRCIVCDSELFKSDTKYESGCGWPAFYDAADTSRLKFVQDYSLVGSANLLLLAQKADLVRTEVLCAKCDAHLGHRFDDGPLSKGGKRYCINSAALRFDPSGDGELSKSSDH